MGQLEDAMTHVFDRVILSELAKLFGEKVKNNSLKLVLQVQVVSDQLVALIISEVGSVKGRPSTTKRFEVSYEPSIHKTMFCLYEEPQSLLSTPGKLVFCTLVCSNADMVAEKLLELYLNRRLSASNS